MTFDGAVDSSATLVFDDTLRHAVNDNAGARVLECTGDQRQGQVRPRFDLGAVPELHVDLDLAVDLNDDATERAIRQDHSSWRAERACSDSRNVDVYQRSVELVVTAARIPEKLIVDLTGAQINDTIHISNIELPAGTRPTITDRDFVIANIQAPSGLKSQEGEAAEEAAAS